MRFIVAEALLESQGKTLLSSRVRARISAKDARGSVLSDNPREDRERAAPSRAGFGGRLGPHVWPFPERGSATADGARARRAGGRAVGSAGPHEADLRVFAYPRGRQAFPAGLRQNADGGAARAARPVRRGRRR